MRLAFYIFVTFLAIIILLNINKNNLFTFNKEKNNLYLKIAKKYKKRSGYLVHIRLNDNSVIGSIKVFNNLRKQIKRCLRSIKHIGEMDDISSYLIFIKSSRSISSNRIAFNLINIFDKSSCKIKVKITILEPNLNDFSLALRIIRNKSINQFDQIKILSKEYLREYQLLNSDSMYKINKNRFKIKPMYCQSTIYSYVYLNINDESAEVIDQVYERQTNEYLQYLLEFLKAEGVKGTNYIAKIFPNISIPMAKYMANFINKYLININVMVAIKIKNNQQIDIDLLCVLKELDIKIVLENPLDASVKHIHLFDFYIVNKNDFLYLDRYQERLIYDFENVKNFLDLNHFNQRNVEKIKIIAEQAQKYNILARIMPKRINYYNSKRQIGTLYLRGKSLWIDIFSNIRIRIRLSNTENLYMAIFLLKSNH